MTAREAAPKRAMLAYGFLAMPLAFAGLPIYINAPDFYATHHGLSLGVIGTVLLIVRGWDAVQDPLLGIFGDRLARFRRYWMALGMVALAIGMGLLFFPPAQSSGWWFGISMLLATSAFGLLTIGLNTLGGLWSDAPDQRTRIAGWREGCGLVGLLLAAILPSALMLRQGADQAFHTTYFVFLALLLIGAGVFLRWLARTPIATGEGKPRLALWGIARRNRLFFAVYAISTLAASLPAVLVIPFIRDRLDAENWTGLFLAVYFLSGALGMGFWIIVSRRIGKARSWTLAMLLAVGSFSWCYFLGAGDRVSYGIICAVSGLALGADLCLPPSIMADRIGTGEARGEAAQHYAWLAFLSKLALALAGGIALADAVTRGLYAERA